MQIVVTVNESVVLETKILIQSNLSMFKYNPILLYVLAKLLFWSHHCSLMVWSLSYPLCHLSHCISGLVSRANMPAPQQSTPIPKERNASSFFVSVTGLIHWEAKQQKEKKMPKYFHKKPYTEKMITACKNHSLLEASLPYQPTECLLNLCMWC